jgi:hypothetical protein
MPPKHYITFVKGDTEITFGIYCMSRDLESRGLRLLNETVKHPLDYKIKVL